jgi:hypothetical protein
MKENAGLSPPWYTLHHKITHSIGADPTIHVLPLREEGSKCYIDVLCTDIEEAYPLASLLRPRYDLGNITVFVQVLDPSRKPIKPEWPTGCEPTDCLYLVVTKALKNNPLFVQAIKPVFPPGIPPPPHSDVVAVIKKVVIQFWNDDLSDFYGNFNGVAENVFKEVILEEYPGDKTLWFTTENTG